MVTLITHLVCALALVSGLGLVIGWATCASEPPSRAGRLAALAAGLAYLGALVVAVAGWAPGRAGLWLEIALGVGGAYAIGAALGGLAGARLGRPPLLWRRAAPDPLSPPAA